HPVVTVAGALRLRVRVTVLPLLSRSVMVQRLLPVAARLFRRNAPPVPALIRPVAVPVPPALRNAFLLLMPAHAPPTDHTEEPQSSPPYAPFSAPSARSSKLTTASVGGGGAEQDVPPFLVQKVPHEGLAVSSPKRKP